MTREPQRNVFGKENRGVLQVNQIANCPSWAILVRNFSAKLGRARVGLGILLVDEKKERFSATSPERKKT